MSLSRLFTKGFSPMKANWQQLEMNHWPVWKGSLSCFPVWTPRFHYLAHLRGGLEKTGTTIKKWDDLSPAPTTGSHINNAWTHTTATSAQFSVVLSNSSDLHIFSNWRCFSLPNHVLFSCLLRLVWTPHTLCKWLVFYLDISELIDTPLHLQASHSTSNSIAVFILLTIKTFHCIPEISVIFQQVNSFSAYSRFKQKTVCGSKLSQQ